MLPLAEEPAVTFHRILLLSPFKFNLYEQSSVAIITFLKRSKEAIFIALNSYAVNLKRFLLYEAA
ncbi:hypothetical protein T02_14518 [Trichinella nativa]|uniref:Uncharacterized protein n=1 Tax=Trichinella nativa TaxID=6335 RepID=A0A0V1LJ92_9BILA|nr:hypothetical protein T06_3827 [Trichinella sp. T6]KRZ59555.1 hypothetical protein T02_14518 [Trichinella nativa]